MNDSKSPTDHPADSQPQQLGSDDPTLPLRLSDAPTLAVLHTYTHRLSPGQTFGRYEIVRPLGKGGMGEVYEAVERETGRRLALKLLASPLASPEERKRFLREGQVAASINHPNTVYVYGAEEINGQPVITMELVRGGTLRDLVEERGPLPVQEAVDKILDVIDGLEAASDAGILHRDIKPANCFLEPDGHVKVGDFGLSISSKPGLDSKITATGAVLGTPAFASPEQLRGEPLDVRSDIYSLGATLYYLLTGDAPFRGENAVQVIAKVLDAEPEPLRKARRRALTEKGARAQEARGPAPGRRREPVDLPMAKELEVLVQQCLAKAAAKRPQSYGELREGLAPFRLLDLHPPPRGRRALAAMLDVLFFLIICIAGLLSLAFSDALDRRSAIGLTLVASFPVLLTEILWKGSPGKLVFGLRIRRADGRRASAFRIFLRFAALYATVYLLSQAITFLTASIPDGAIDNENYLYSPLFIVSTLLIFATAKRRNVYAGIHDLVSNTRVVARPRPLVPRASSRSEINACHSEGERVVGPYVLHSRNSQVFDSIDAGVDSVLQRDVWIEWLSDAATPLSEARTNIGRPTRLRWANSGQVNGSAWRAYQAPTGAPFLSLLHTTQSWSRVKRWLIELASEFDAAMQDQALPNEISLAHIWIDANDHAILLDFPLSPAKQLFAEELDRRSFGTEWNSVQRFLHRFAMSALRSSREAPRRDSKRQLQNNLPLHGIRVLARLESTEFSGPRELVELIRSQIDLPDRLTIGLRAKRILAFAFFPLFAAGLLSGMLALFTDRIFIQNPDLSRLYRCASVVQRLDELILSPGESIHGSHFHLPISRGRRTIQVSGDPMNVRDSFQTYIAAEFGHSLLDGDFRRLRALFSWDDEDLAHVDSIVARLGRPSEESARQARAVVEPIISRIRESRVSLSAFVNTFNVLLPIVALFDILSTLFFVGGAILAAFGGTLVNARDLEISRVRGSIRSIIAWSSMLAPLVLQSALIGLIVGALWTLTGRRGIHDILTGTRVIAR